MNHKHDPWLDPPTVFMISDMSYYIILYSINIYIYISRHTYTYMYIYIWYDMIWYDMIWYDMIWYDMIWYDMIWYDIHTYFISPLNIPSEDLHISQRQVSRQFTAGSSASTASSSASANASKAARWEKAQALAEDVVQKLRPLKSGNDGILLVKIKSHGKTT